MKIGLIKPRTDLAIKHIQMNIDGKEYFICFHYSLRNGIKDVRVYREPVRSNRFADREEVGGRCGRCGFQKGVLKL